MVCKKKNRSSRVKDRVLHFAPLQLSVLRVVMWPSEIRLVVSLDKFSAINVDLVGSARHNIPPIACELHPCLDPKFMSCLIV